MLRNYQLDAVLVVRNVLDIARCSCINFVKPIAARELLYSVLLKTILLPNLFNSLFSPTNNSQPITMGSDFLNKKRMFAIWNGNRWWKIRCNGLLQLLALNILIASEYLRLRFSFDSKIISSFWSNRWSISGNETVAVVRFAFQRDQLERIC